MFILFGSFGAFALLVGVISEGIYLKGKMRIEEDRVKRETRRKLLNEQVGMLFDEAHLNDEGSASLEELSYLLPYVEEMFKVNNVMFVLGDLKNIWAVMDRDDSGDISKDEFCQAIVSLAERGQPMSSVEIHYTISLLKAKFTKCEPAIMETGKALRTQEAYIKLLARNQEALSRKITQNFEDASSDRRRTEERLERCETALMDIGKSMAYLIKNGTSDPKSAPEMRSIWEEHKADDPDSAPSAAPKKLKARAKDGDSVRSTSKDKDMKKVNDKQTTAEEK